MQDTKKTYYAIFFVIAVLVSFIAAFSAKGVSAGFVVRFIAAVVAVPAGFIGFLVGDFIRKLAIPDAVLVSGGMFALLRTRLFWMCGPQLIGLSIGSLVVAGNVLKLLG